MLSSMREGCGKLKKVTSSSRENLFVKMRKKILLMLLAMILVFMSGCAEEKKQIALNQSNNTSGYEFEVFLNEYNNNVPANTTTYYLLEDKTTAKVVNLEINCSKLEIYPPDSLGGSSAENPIQNFVLLVEPANETAADAQTFEELSHRNETSDVNYTLTQEISQNMKVLNLTFEEPVTGFIAYTIEVPGTQNFVFMKPDSVFFRVILPPGYDTGNRIFGIARPAPSNESFDEKGRKNLLWISSKLGERDEAIQVKYYSQSAPLLFLGAIIALLIGVGLVLFYYSRSKKELESVKGIFELEREYEKKQKRRK
jgi:Family of unknown function (DUF5803)